MASREADPEVRLTNKKDKDKKEKKSQIKDASGNDLKRPLSAYMLFNNYRRPVLRSEHPGKYKIKNQHTYCLLDVLTILQSYLCLTYPS